jgi:medium-chain acyl-[acyl-carrier-protein] hydrolase
LMQVMLPILRADFTLYETYSYKEEPPLACTISAFAGEKDNTVSAQEMAGWRAQTLGPFSLRILPGEHFFLHSSQDRLLQCISQDLTALLRSRLE